MSHALQTYNRKFIFIPNIGWILDKADLNQVSIVQYSPNMIIGADTNQSTWWLKIDTIDFIQRMLVGRVVGQKNDLTFKEAVALATPFNGNDKHVSYQRTIPLMSCHLPSEADDMNSSSSESEGSSDKTKRYKTDHTADMNSSDITSSKRQTGRCDSCGEIGPWGCYCSNHKDDPFNEDVYY